MKRLTSNTAPAATWDERLRATLGRYEAGLLRGVGDQLVRLQTKRPLPEVIDKVIETVGNSVVLDRRLKELHGPARALLGLIGLSHRPAWRLGGLLELLSAFRVPDAMVVVFQLFEAGLLYPELDETKAKLKSFSEWLANASGSGFQVYTHPHIAARALVQWLAKHPEEDEPFSSLKLETVVPTKDAREADGIEWFLRLGAIWQMVKAAPLRLTQSGDFFKRDQERLANEPLFTAPAADELAALPQLGHWMIALGLGEGTLRVDDGQVVAAEMPESWSAGLAASIRGLWANINSTEGWNADEGWKSLHHTGSPYPAAAVLIVALLAKLPADEWAVVDSVADWLANHHCYWAPPRSAAVVAESVEEPESADVEMVKPPQSLVQWTRRFLLGIAYQLRLVSVAHPAHGPKGQWVVRLAPMGRAAVAMATPPNVPDYPKTLLVQPNLEMIAYRQGLTPDLIGNLSRFAVWKTLGPACTLQLDPESIYRGLETGLTWEKLVQTLQRHSARELPVGVLQSLRTWADKRERLTVFTSATLMEFHSAAEMQAALSRGLPGTPVSDHIALVIDESAIEFREFRLLGTRDYGLPPDRCVEVDSDGVTLAIDVSRADLLLETELQRFALPSANGRLENRRTYRVTPETLRRAAESGLTTRGLEEWFQQRTGNGLPAATRLLLSDANTPPLVARTQIVLEVPSTFLADGLMQWPETRKLIRSRLGPQALVVAKSDLDALTRMMHELRLTLKHED